MYGTYPFTTQLRHIPNGIPFAEQTYYFPIFGFHLFCHFYRAYLAPEFSTFLYIPFLPNSFIAKVRDVKFKAKVDDADIEKLTDDRKKLIGDESKLLEDY